MGFVAARENPLNTAPNEEGEGEYGGYNHGDLDAGREKLANVFDASGRLVNGNGGLSEDFLDDHVDLL